MKWIFTLLMGFLINGCAHQVPTNDTRQSESVSANSDKSLTLDADGEQKLVYLDSSAFDLQLSEKLKSGVNSIVIEVIDIDVNHVPERLDKWLSAIAQYKGNVEVMPSEEFPAGGLSIQALVLAYDFYDFGKEKLMYGAAKKYNARVDYQPEDGSVQRIIFTPKEEVE